MRRIIWFASLLLLAIILIIMYFRNVERTNQEITLINPLGPTIIPVTGIVNGDIKTSEISSAITVDFYKNTDEAVGRLAGDDVDFAVLPLSTAASIYNQGLEIKLLGIHEWKVFYMIASQNNLSDFKIAQLRGQEIYLAHNRGNTLDLIFRCILAKSGLEPDRDVKLLYAPPQEIVGLFQSSQIKWAVLPEPFTSLALQNNPGKIVLDLQEIWGKTFNTQARVPIAGLFVKTSFLEKYPRETQVMVDLFRQSTDWANSHIPEAIQINNKILPVPADAMETALKNIEFRYEASPLIQDEVNNFWTVLNSQLPEDNIPIPNGGFYAP